MIYHFACPAKYRRVVFDESVDNVIKEICQEIEKRYDSEFKKYELYDKMQQGEENESDIKQ